MLVPAICYEDKLLKLFSKEIYTQDWFFYTGYPRSFNLPEIKLFDNEYQYAVVNEDELIGYFTYKYDPLIDECYSFGLYSFDRGNMTVIKDVFNKMEELVSKHHRIGWEAIQGNPVTRNYEDFCKKHGGRILTFKEAAIDLNGNYVDRYAYEIVKDKRYDYTDYKKDDKNNMLNVDTVILLSLEDYQANVLKSALEKYIKQNPNYYNNNILYFIINRIDNLILIKKGEEEGKQYVAWKHNDNGIDKFVIIKKEEEK